MQLTTKRLLFTLGFMLLLMGQTSCSTQKKAEWATSSGSSAQQGKAYAREAELSENQTWDHYLFLIGEKLGCYFTLEYIVTGQPDCGLNSWVASGEKVKCLDDLLVKLRQELKGFIILQDKSHPRIIHIIEAELMNDRAYPLNKQMDLKYSGTLDLLPKTIGQTITNLDTKGFGQHPDSAYGDTQTKVSIRVANQSVRSILTQVVPLYQYPPKLWRAETYERPTGRMVYVQYYGPRS